MADNPHDSHRERMRERFLKYGLKGFYDHEVLELLLYYAIPRQDTNPIAHRLLAHFGSLSGVLEADAKALEQVEGMGERSAALLRLIPPICQRYLDSKYTEGMRIESLEDAGSFMKQKFIGETDEVILAAALDSKRQVLLCDELARGTVNASSITARKVAEFAIRSQGVGMILAHNHPNGVALPSRADVETTRSIAQALQMLGVRLLDHIIVAGDDYISMAESGLLPQLTSAK